MSSFGRAAVSGLSGALALTSVHQVARLLTADAPRMDVVGRRAIAAGIEATGREAPDETTLQRWALAGDVLSNSAYYSMVAWGRRPNVWTRGVALGLAAGIGALVLPRRMGLGDPPRSFKPANQLMTVAWYTIGGVVAASTASSTR